MILSNLSNLLNIESFDSLLNLLIVTPLLHYVEMDWVRFSIVSLILAVILVIKEILMILATFSKSKSDRNKSSGLLWRFINSLIVIPMTYLQYKSDANTKYTKWLSGLYVFYNFVKMYVGGNTQESAKKSKSVKDVKGAKGAKGVKDVKDVKDAKANVKNVNKKNHKSKQHKKHLTKKEINYFLHTYNIVDN
jgi:hypothetical protein